MATNESAHFGSTVESETFQFDSARTLQHLYANDLRLLQALEDRLGLKITTRDGWLRLEGERASIEKARQVFDQLEEARQRGIQIKRQEFQYALDAATGEAQESLGQLANFRVQTSERRSAIVPKSGQQLAYVQ